MKLNRTLAYGLACLEYLSHKRDREWVEVKEIAAHQGLPVAYCNKVLQALAHANLVKSVRGKGCRLAADPDDINVWQIMEAFTLNGAPPSSRPGADLRLYRSLQHTVDGWLETVSLTEIIEKSKDQEGPSA